MRADPSTEHHESEPASVEIRVIGGSAPAGWMPVEEEEEVVRLEKTPPTVRNSFEDVGPAGPEPQPRRRRRKGWFHQRHLTLAMAGVVGILTVLAVIGLRFRDDDSPGTPAPFSEIAVEREEQLTSLGQLSANAQEYLEKARAKVRRYLAAEQASEILPLIRDRSRWRSLLEQQWQPLRMRDEKVDHMQMAFSEQDGHAWFSLNGRDEDGQNVQLVFVPKGADVELDWGASFGVGELPFELLDQMEVGQEAVMRVVVASDNYHTKEFPEDQYRCYKLTPRFNEDWVWAYAKVGSPESERLAAMLRTESTFLEVKEEARVILKLGRTESCGRKQFEILALLAEQWIELEETD